MTVKLLTEQHLEILSLKGGWAGMSEYTLVKMPHCWKSHVLAHISFSSSEQGVLVWTQKVLSEGSNSTLTGFYS